jgi:hypothetical protein
MLMKKVQSGVDRQNVAQRDSNIYNGPLSWTKKKDNFCKKCCQMHLQELKIIKFSTWVNLTNSVFQYGGNVTCVGGLSAFITRDDGTRRNIAEKSYCIWKKIQKRNPKLMLQNKKKWHHYVNADKYRCFWKKWNMFDVLTCYFGWC